MQKRVLGLTGPTGAGKSAAAAVFAQEGCTVIDCDRVARDVTRTDGVCLQALADAFGAEILLPDGTLNRRRLAAIAFASRENELKLNAITHPPIMNRVQTEIGAAQTEAVVLDAPLLFESGADALCGQTVAVLARQPIRCSRIMGVCPTASNTLLYTTGSSLPFIPKINRTLLYYSTKPFFVKGFD